VKLVAEYLPPEHPAITTGRARWTPSPITPLELMPLTGWWLRSPFTCCLITGIFDAVLYLSLFPQCWECQRNAKEASVDKIIRSPLDGDNPRARACLYDLMSHPSRRVAHAHQAFPHLSFNIPGTPSAQDSHASTPDFSTARSALPIPCRLAICRLEPGIVSPFTKIRYQETFPVPEITPELEPCGMARLNHTVQSERRGMPTYSRQRALVSGRIKMITWSICTLTGISKEFILES